MTGALTLAALLLGGCVLLWPGARRRALTGRPTPVAAVTPPPSVGTLGVPVLVELLCAALEAGLPSQLAVEAVLTAAGDAVPAPDQQSLRALVATTGAVRPSVQGPLARVARAFAVSERTGASAAQVLRRAAADERAAHRRRVARATGRLGVRLVLPLGVSILPSFVLLGVAPVVLGLASDLRLW